MNTALVRELELLMEDNKKIVVLTADMGYSVFETIQKEYPSRFFNLGITEQSSTSIAAGLALMGYEVFFYAQAPFITMRNYEQVRLDLAYNNVNVRLIGANAGLSLNQLGVSHFAVEDVALMRLLPNMNVFTPGTPDEMKWCIRESHNTRGPTYLRFSKTFSESSSVFPKHNRTDGILLISGGLLKMGIDIASSLKKEGIFLSCYSYPVVWPFDYKQFAKQVGSLPIFTLEEHSILGGLGTIVSEAVIDMNMKNRVTKFGLNNAFIHGAGSIDYLFKSNGLDPKHIQSVIQNQLKK